MLLEEPKLWNPKKQQMLVFAPLWEIRKMFTENLFRDTS